MCMYVCMYVCICIYVCMYDYININRIHGTAPLILSTCIILRIS